MSMHKSTVNRFELECKDELYLITCTAPAKKFNHNTTMQSRTRQQIICGTTTLRNLRCQRKGSIHENDASQSRCWRDTALCLLPRAT